MRSRPPRRGRSSGLADTAEDVAARLAALNGRYVEKFGFIFILFATGRTPADVLAHLEERLGNDRPAEVPAWGWPIGAEGDAAAAAPRKALPVTAQIILVCGWQG